MIGRAGDRAEVERDARLLDQELDGVLVPQRSMPYVGVGALAARVVLSVVGGNGLGQVLAGEGAATAVGQRQAAGTRASLASADNPSGASVGSSHLAPEFSHRSRY